MSWTPRIWIKKTDFEFLKSSIADLRKSDDMEEFQAWTFDIGDVEGVVFSAGETTQQHVNLHEVIKTIPHWLLSSEYPYSPCHNCHIWGDEIDLEYLWHD